MNKKQLTQRKRLAAIFASFAILIVGGISLLENMSIDYFSVLGTLEKVIPASIIMGGLGWVMGMVLDKPKRKTGRYNTFFLKDIAETQTPKEQNEEKVEENNN